MIDDEAEYNTRRQIRAQADADVAAFIASLDQDEESGVPPPVKIKISEVSTQPVEFAPFDFGHEESGTSPAPQSPPPPVPAACCLPDESCELLTSVACGEAGGAFHAGHTCDDVDCSNPCCPGCTSFSLTGMTVNMICTVEGAVNCACTGSVGSFSPVCHYEGGCNTDCSSMPVFVDLQFFGGVWQIQIFIEATGVCDFQDPPNPPVPNQWCTGWDGLSCNYIDLVEGCDPDGTYSFDLTNEGVSPDTCNVSFTLANLSGACCDAFDDCTLRDESCCDDSGGTFHGVGSVCDPNPCVEATGACCTLGGDCDVTTPTLCALIGGTYLGDGVSCSPNPC